jgi:NAD+ synthase (glutamine-hydrolysing)
MNFKLCQINPIVGDLKGNSEKIISLIRASANESGNELTVLVFPELAVSGYPPLDLLDNSHFISEQLEYVNKIVQGTQGPNVIIFGYIEKNPGVGRNLFNSALVCSGGKVIYNYRKRLLPTYDVFDEARYFEPGKDMGFFNIKGKRVGLVICEDLWYGNKFYTINPAQELYNAHADMIISINASPSVVGKYMQKIEMVTSICKTYGLPIIYVNQVGSTDDIVFDGNSFAVNKDGVIIAHSERYYENTLQVPEEALSRYTPTYCKGVPLWNPISLNSSYNFESDAQFFYEQAVHGIRDYIKKCGFKGVVIGESGGIDSAVVTALAVDALGKGNVMGITMPSQYSSEGSYKDSEILCNNFGVILYNYQIKDIYTAMLQQFNYTFPESTPGLAEENLQARIRGQILMTFSNRYGYLVLSTGNKSELSVGYCVMGNSYIRNSLGMLTAEELYEEFPSQIKYKGHLISNSFQSVKKEKITITTQIRNELSTSGDHEYKIYDPYKKSYFFKKAEEIVEGDLLVLQIGSNIWGNSTILPYFKYNKNSHDFRSSNFKPPIEITNELSKFLGICIADGSYNVAYRIRSTKQYVADFCLKILHELDLPDSCYKQTAMDENGAFFIEICSIQFMTWLKFIGVKHGALNKDVPVIIRKAPKDIIQAFLSGLLLDSTANSKKHRSEIIYHSNSIILARQTHLLFLNLGVLSFFREYKRAGYNAMYEVYIPPYETYKLEELGVIKHSIISRIKKNNGESKLKSVVDYIYGMENHLIYIKNKLKENQRESIRRTLRMPIVKIGRQTLIKYASMLPEDDSVRAAVFMKLLSDEYIIPCIATEKEIGEYTMYDFSVEDIHEFNANGIDVHNCTQHGDMCGGLAPISDLYKMEVYAVSKYINKLHGKEMIPQVIIDKEPSAELAPNQRDVDSLPPYPVLDALLKFFIEGEVLPKEEFMICEAVVKEHASDAARILKLINKAEFKRRQAAITIKMHQKAFGYGRRIPIAQKWVESI